MLHQQPANTSRYYDNMSMPPQNKKKTFFFFRNMLRNKAHKYLMKEQNIGMKNETRSRTCVKWLIVTTCSKTKVTTSTKCSFNVVCWLGKYEKSM